MFNGRLYKFQSTHEENLLEKCADYKEMVLYALALASFGLLLKKKRRRRVTTW